MDNVDDQRPGTKPGPSPVLATCAAQLAGLVADLLPGLDTDGRLELLGAMTPEDMSTSLAFIATMHP